MTRVKTYIKCGDTVQAIAGKERGKSGKVLRILSNGRAVVEKLNLIKRHTKANPQTGQGGIVEKEASMHLSNLMLLCPDEGKPVRVRKKILEDGKKVRVSANSGEMFDE